MVADLVMKMTVTNKDGVVVVSLVLSLVSLVLLFGVTWYFQSSLHLLQQQVEYDRELLLNLQEQVNAKVTLSAHIQLQYCCRELLIHTSVSIITGI